MKRIIFMLVLTVNTIIFGSSFEGYWMTQEKGYNTQAVIEVTQENGMYKGEIKYIAFVDKEFNFYGYTLNDNFISFKLIKNFTQYDENRYRNGRVINPQNNKEYYARAKVKNGKLYLRGSLDPFGILGLTRVWKKIDINELLEKEEIKKYDK